MKQIKFYSFASALMLASAVGLGSCSSDSVEPGGGGLAGETVKTQFAINIPRAGSNNGTRATGSQTQGNGTTFLGMKNIWLLSFEDSPTDNSASTGTMPLGAIDANENISSSNSSKIYQNVSVNTGTSHFIFYGFGNISDNKIGTFNKDLTLENTTRKNLSEISFKLKPVVDNTIDYNNGEPKAIIDALNNIDKNWQQSDENLKQVLETYHKLKAGSAKSVCGMIQDIFNYVNKNYGTNYPNAITQLKATINSCEKFSIGEDNVVKTDLTFPRNLGLPDGAVSVEYTTGTGFAYKQPTKLDAMEINPTSITYPALLSYYTNTPIYTNEARVNDWPKTTSDWNASKFSAGWTTSGAKVTSSTAAIALANNINYGVASLKLKVKCKQASLPQGGTDAGNVNVPKEGFNVTGLLIGNQPDEADYKFAPKANDTFSKTIWDSKVNLTASTSEPTEANYTIVLPNKTAEETQKDVMFALELENNSDQAFNGYDGVVEKGAKFYLVGTMKPSGNTQTGVTVPSGVTNPSVFMSDYQTELTATISSLKTAYNCIPDIRTTMLQLGLSVDLTWQEGIKYDIEIGGGN